MRVSPSLLAVTLTAAPFVHAQNSTGNRTMQRIEYNGIPFNTTVETVPIPELRYPSDAIIRITKAALCGSDLHYVRGFTTSSGDIGHEAMGYVEALGDGVKRHSVGDYVVLPAINYAGGVQMAPEQSNTDQNTGMQGQRVLSEYARIPDADANLIPIPLTRNNTNSSIERDYLLIGDVWPTAWQAVRESGFESGDTIAIWGAGPVGLMAAYTAKLRGASKIFVIDRIQQRLDIAESMGAMPVNFETQNVTEVVLGQEPRGVLRQVEAVGFEAYDPSLAYDPDYIWTQIFSIAHYGGGITLAGVWQHSETPTQFAPRAAEISSNVTFPYGQFWGKRVKIATGLVEPTRHAGELVRLVESGVARGFGDMIMTADISIDETPEYYQRFSDWEEVKVYISFP
ncbi:hypothetical protein NX059_011910 [Plenodomus lindquistii]|nr:hypothetical protein NX059_011910 [Plenodomus lindquistii]